VDAFAPNASADPATGREPVLSFSNSTTTATGKIERVLSAQSDDYRYRAYVVRWHGARVVVEDVLAHTHYNLGDEVNFWVTRVASSRLRRIDFMLGNVYVPQKPISAEALAGGQ
jgi:hypothetical protein